MPRRKTNTVTVTAYARLRNGQLYHGRIKKIRHQRGQHCLHVEIENLDPGQRGRIHVLDLPLPVRPGNRASALLLACGCEACRIGAVIDLDVVVDHIVGLRSRGQEADGNERFDFERIADGSVSENTPATEGPRMERSESEATAVPRNDDLRTY